MFGEVKFHLSWVYAFNNQIDCLFQDPMLMTADSNP